MAENAEEAMAFVDPGRLQRAIHLHVGRQEDGSWLVTGGTAPHRVVAIGGDLRCDCEDAGYRPGPCKHRLRVQLGRLGAPMLAALRTLVPKPAGNSVSLSQVIEP